MLRVVAAALVVFALAPASADAQYCAASVTNCNTGGNELITRVQFGTIDHTSPNNGSLPCYNDYTSVSTALTPGSTYNFTMEYSNPFSGDTGAVWIDWNANQLFEAGEQYTLTGSGGVLTYTALPVPVSAATGATRMRVRVAWSTVPPACLASPYGEIEDYTVNILPPSTGACCVLTSPTCSITTQGACTGAGTTYRGNGTSCSPNLCEGACCIPTSPTCTITTSGACAGGTFQGAGTSCEPSNPCGGACCTGTSCAVSLASACPSGSVFVNHGACTATSCDYCTASVTFCSDGANERITRVLFAGIDNPSSGSAGEPCYTDYTSISTSVSPGSTHTFTFEYANPATGDTASVWFDWNRDFVFGDIAAGEQVILSRNVGSVPASFSASVTVPPGASTGFTRMRVRVGWSSVPPACLASSYGEVEDYSINTLAANTGACCALSSPTCSTTTQAACTGAGRTYRGDATSCTPNLCEGVCCIPGSPTCTITTPGACTGTFQGAGTTCATSNPCGGACCTGASCAVSLASGCPSGSIFTNNAACGPTTCEYCTAGAAGCSHPQNEFITRVVFAGIDNFSTGDPGQACYTDFTSVSAPVVQGSHHTVTFQYTFPTTLDQGTVWFDWNRDLVFGDVASGEQVNLTHPNGDPVLFSGNVTVPPGASLGSTRMRVRVLYSGIPVACGNNSYGDVEDYTLNVQVATTGACCAASGSCTVTTPGGCAVGFQGLASSCEPSNPCGGACCDSNGSCTVTTAATCPGGSSFINHRVCSATACNGSCCDSAGFCSSVVNAAACSGGTFGGAGSSCSPSPCPGQSCANPTPLALGVPVAGDISSSVSNSQVSCSVGVKGLWYSFTAGAAGDYAFASTVTSGSATPTIAVFSSCGNELVCSTTTVVRAMTVGQTLVFRAGALNDAPHTYNVSVNTVVNGACCNTTSGSCSTTIVGANGCAAGTSYMGNGSVCSPNPCGQGACCHGPTGACTLATATGCVSPRVFQTAGTTCSPNPCSIPPVNNGLCSTAASLSLNVPYQGNNSPDTGDGTEGPGGSCYFGNPANFSRAVWFTFTAPATTNYLVSACGSLFDTSMSVFEQTAQPACDNLVELACNDDDCIGGTSDSPMPGPGPGNIYSSLIANLPMTAGTTYHIRLAAWSTSGAGGAYGMVVQYAAGVTLGSCCVASACSVTEPGDCTGTFAVGGSCSPNPCAVSTGACCAGATCTVTTQAACTGANTGWTTAGSTCNAAGNTPCCKADFNRTGSVSVQDLFDYLGAWFGRLATADVNGNPPAGGGVSVTVQDLFDYLALWFGAPRAPATCP